MNMEKKYTKKDAIEASKEFLKKVRELENEFGISFNSDEGDDFYLTYLTKDTVGKGWSTIKIGWDGDSTGLKVQEDDTESIREQALSKLTEKELEVLGLN